MFKFVYHILIFIIGASLGIWWGVNHPTSAANMVGQEEAHIAQAKVELLQKLNGNPSAENIKQQLEVEQQKLQQTMQH